MLLYLLSEQMREKNTKQFRKSNDTFVIHAHTHFISMFTIVNWLFSCGTVERRTFVFNRSWLAHIFALGFVVGKFWKIDFPYLGFVRITLKMNVFHPAESAARLAKCFPVFLVWKYMPLVGYVVVFMFMFINTKTICHFVSFFSCFSCAAILVELWTVPVDRWFWQTLIFIADNIVVYIQNRLKYQQWAPKKTKKIFFGRNRFLENPRHLAYA